MPFPFTLPSTQRVTFEAFFYSPSHTRLPEELTRRRAALCESLDRYSRQTDDAKILNSLRDVQRTTQEYTAYLYALDVAVNGGCDKRVGGERIVVEVKKELVVYWKSTLNNSSSTLEQSDELGFVQLRGIEGELAFVLTLLGLTNSLLARCQLNLWWDDLHARRDEGQQTAVTASIMRLYFEANAIHATLANRISRTHERWSLLNGKLSGGSGYIKDKKSSASFSSTGTASGTSGYDDRSVYTSDSGACSSMVVDVLPNMQCALASLALAEASLVCMLKDDLITDILSSEAADDKIDGGGGGGGTKTEILGGASLSGERAHFYTRLSLAAGESATKARESLIEAYSRAGGDSDAKPDERLIGYVEELSKAAHGKACRFMGIDAYTKERFGEAIGWIEAGIQEVRGGLDTCRNGLWRGRGRGRRAYLFKDDFLGDNNGGGRNGIGLRAKGSVSGGKHRMSISSLRKSDGRCGATKLPGRLNLNDRSGSLPGPEKGALSSLNEDTKSVLGWKAIGGGGGSGGVIGKSRLFGRLSLFIKRGFVGERREVGHKATIGKVGASWSVESGSLHELCLLEELKNKWMEENDELYKQDIPSYSTLMNILPTGREYYKPQAFVQPCLSETGVAALRERARVGENYEIDNDDGEHVGLSVSSKLDVDVDMNRVTNLNIRGTGNGGQVIAKSDNLDGKGLTTIDRTLNSGVRDEVSGIARDTRWLIFTCASTVSSMSTCSLTATATGATHESCG